MDSRLGADTSAGACWAEAVLAGSVAVFPLSSLSLSWPFQAASAGDMPARARRIASSNTKPASHQASRSLGEKPSRFHWLGSDWSSSDIRLRLVLAESSHCRASSGSKPLSDQVRATKGVKPARFQLTASFGVRL